MNRASNAWKALCALLLLLVLISAPAHAATVSFQVKNGGSVVAATNVTLYLSYGKEVSTSDANGSVSFDVGNARGFWVEVDGKRLGRFFHVNQVPAVIDMAQTGTIQWGGRR
jgi:hypothetical protein